MSWPVVRNAILFVTGAVILLLELEWHEHTRGWVIGLALFMMGVVTADQIRQYVSVRQPIASAEQKDWPRMPVEGLQHPQEPPTPPSTPRTPDDAA